MSANKKLVVFVHGWSVRSTDTYGGLPERLKSEAAQQRGLALDVRHIWLSKYVSFHNKVTVPDIVQAFDAALKKELGKELSNGRGLICITHSTGGPVVREWLQEFYFRRGKKRTPISHLVMLAPANFGSALAQLGSSRLGRLKTWFEGVEPGLGVLDWLELGSPESWQLNKEWLDNADEVIANGTYPFVLTGVSIDPRIYDHVNSYTGETGSDGVVRVAAANLNMAHFTIQQKRAADHSGPLLPLKLGKGKEIANLPLALIEGRSHSGDAMGIMRSVHDDDQPHPTVDALLKCIVVSNRRDHAKLVKEFEQQRQQVEARQRVEILDVPGHFDRKRINDPCAMVIFRVRDDLGNTVSDFEILFYGRDNNLDALPPGFLIDKQKNRRDPGVITFYFNAARMQGCEPIHHDGEEIRPALRGCEHLGLRVVPYPQSGFVHYLTGELSASASNLRKLICANQTTLVDIVLHRVIHAGVFRLSRELHDGDFTRDPEGDPV